MLNGCTNPKAVNYDPNAAQDDGSCYYLNKIGGTCYAFEDVDPNEIIDQSFTMSWSIEGDNWVFFHDYVPDFYFSTREQLHNLKGGSIYHHNQGPFGVYHDPTPKSFLIDAVFSVQDKTETTLNTINWIARVINQDGAVSPFETLTHITVWNEKQCTGRIPLAAIFQNLEYTTARNLQGRWSFNDFRDQVIQQGVAFLQDIFHNFATNPANLSTTIPWFDQQLLEGVYFIVRLEFDNTSGKQLFLEDVQIDGSKSFR